MGKGNPTGNIDLLGLVTWEWGIHENDWQLDDWDMADFATVQPTVNMSFMHTLAYMTIADGAYIFREAGALGLYYLTLGREGYNYVDVKEVLRTDLVVWSDAVEIAVNAANKARNEKRSGPMTGLQKDVDEGNNVGKHGELEVSTWRWHYALGSIFVKGQAYVQDNCKDMRIELEFKDYYNFHFINTWSPSPTADWNMAMYHYMGLARAFYVEMGGVEANIDLTDPYMARDIAWQFLR